MQSQTHEDAFELAKLTITAEKRATVRSASDIIAVAVPEGQVSRAAGAWSG